jgi:hypothetical protein
MMKRSFVLSAVLLVIVVFALLASQPEVSIPVQAAAASDSDPCFLSPALFQDTAKPTFKDIPQSHAIKNIDCPFYQPAWQEFLYATKPLHHTQLPAFLSYASFQDIFAMDSSHAAKSDTPAGLMLQLEPRDIERANKPSPEHQRLLDASAAANSKLTGNEALEDIVQAAVGKQVGGSLIDQQGHFIYYAIHANPEMVEFLRASKLTGTDVADRVANAPPFAQLIAPSTPVASLAEYKSAWMIVKNRRAARNYYVTRARVPRYIVDAEGKIAPLQRGPHHRTVTREVWVALLALHVVFTLPGHPEMIWSTFEHVSFHDRSWQRDNALAAKSDPDHKTAVTLVDSGHDYPLYKANTPPEQCNTPITDPKVMAAHWDPHKQSFTKNGLLQTSIYRIYPGSKSGGNPPSSDEDDDIKNINNNATTNFSDSSLHRLKGDKRQFYRLVGAIWMDKPAHLQVGMAISNPDGMSTDDLAADVAGEDGLGSTAMESFTEGVAPHCFSCHDTQAINIVGHHQMPQSVVNVSHLMSKYVGTIPLPQSTPTPTPSH